jgi:ATP-dependent Lon protease
MAPVMTPIESGFRRFVGVILAGALVIAGPLAPFAQAAQEKPTYWNTRRSASSRNLTTDHVDQKLAMVLPALKKVPPSPSKNWFQVNNFTPLFGPKFWRRGETIVPFVTHIQDAHDNSEAQLALSRILSELAEKDKPLLVCVEGAWGPLSTDIFGDLNADERKVKADELLEQHVITGEEYLSITAPGLVQLVGVDDPDLHSKNIAARDQVHTWRPSTLNRIKTLKINMARLKKTLYPARLRTLDEIQTNYLAGTISSQELAKKVLPFAKNEWWLKEFPHIHRLASMDMDSEQASPPPEEIKKWVTSLSDTDFKKKVDELVERRKIDLPALANEMERAPAALLHTDKRFDSLVELDHWIGVIDRLVQLEMTPEDWRYFNNADQTLTIEDVNSKITQIARINNIRLYPLPVAHRREEETTWQAAKEFYSLAKKRDVAMARNTLREAKKYGKSQVVLVAGGFHTPGITRFFRRTRNFHQSLCPIFSARPSADPRPSLRKISHFQTSPAPVSIRFPFFQFRPAFKFFFRFAALMSLSFFVLAAGEGSVSPWLQFALLAVTVSDPILARHRHKNRTPPDSGEKQLTNNDQSIMELKEKLNGRLESNDFPGAIAILDEVTVYSDLRAYGLLQSIQDIGQKKEMINKMPDPLRRRIFNAIPEFEFGLYSHGVSVLIGEISNLGELDSLWREASDTEAVAKLTSAQTNKLASRVSEAKSRLISIMNILDNQSNMIDPLGEDPGKVPAPTPPLNVSEFTLNKINPARNARSMAQEPLRKAVDNFHALKMWLETQVEEKKPKSVSLGWLMGTPSKKLVYVKPPDDPNLVTDLIAELQKENGTLERLKREFYELSFPAASHGTVFRDWKATISSANTSIRVAELGYVPPSSNAEDQKENQRVERIAALTQRMGRSELVDLSLSAQAFLESNEGNVWNENNSDYSHELQEVRKFFLKGGIDRRASVVLPNSSDIRIFAEELAISYRRDRIEKKVILLELSRVITTLPPDMSFETYIRGLIEESKERGNVMLLVDINGIQGEGVSPYVHLMTKWGVANSDDNLAPDLVTLCNERTYTFHLQQESVKNSPPPLTVRTKNTRALTDRRMVQLAQSLSPRAGVSLQGAPLWDIVEMLANVDPFDVVDRAHRWLMDILSREQIHRLRGGATTITQWMTSAIKYPSDHGTLPLEMRAVARMHVMPEDHQTETRRLLQQLSSLRSKQPNSQTIPDIERRLTKLIEMPWVEMAPPTVSPTLNEKEQAKRMIELESMFERRLEQSHAALPENVKTALRGLLGNIILTDMGRNPRGRNMFTVVGPPGVGKTALTQVLADVTHRPVYRISMNLINDPMSLIGSSPTFLHSKEGLVAAKLIGGDPKAGNPIFVFDEIDKTPPAVQNVFLQFSSDTLTDKYIGDINIKGCIIIFTANSLDPVVEALRNRMDVVLLPGYTLDEKVTIAFRHILPRALNDNNLIGDRNNKHHQFFFENTADILEAIVQGYAREEGMRGLIRRINDILLSAFAGFIETGLPTKIDRDFVKSVLGAPIEFLRIPQTDPVGIAYFPHISSNLIDTHAAPKSTPPYLASQPFREMASLVEFLLRERGEEWKNQVSDLFGEQPNAGGAPSEYQIDVPRVVQADAAAQLAMTDAVLSKASGVPIKREVVLLGEVTNKGLVEKVSEIRKRILTAYNAGAHLLILPYENMEEVMQTVFSEVSALRGPVLVSPQKSGEDWMLHYQHAGDKTFSVETGPREIMLEAAEELLQKEGSQCLYVLTRTVEDTFPFVFASPQRKAFTSRPSLRLTVEPPKNPVSSTSEPDRPPLENPHPPLLELSWEIEVKGRKVDLRNIFNGESKPAALAIVREIIDEIQKNPSNSLEKIAQLEACARYSLVHQWGGGIIDKLLTLDADTRARIVSEFSPETLGVLVYQKSIEGYHGEEADQWEKSLLEFKKAQKKIEDGTFDKPTAKSLQAILNDPALFPPLVRENGEHIFLVGLKFEISNYLAGTGKIEDLKAHLDEIYGEGNRCFFAYKDHVTYAINGQIKMTVRRAMENRFTEQAIFRPLMSMIPGKEIEVDRAWRTYLANLKIEEELNGTCQFIPLGQKKSADTTAIDTLFNAPADRFVEVMSRDDNRTMILTGCPPPLKNAWVQYWGQRLFAEGMPHRILKIDISRLMEDSRPFTVRDEVKWFQLLEALKPARDSGNTVAWIDLDLIPPETDPFIVSRIIQFFNQRPGSVPLFFTGGELVHRHYTDSSPVYAQEVVRESLNNKDRKTIFQLELTEREKLTGIAYPRDVVNYLTDRVSKGEIGLSLARRILDRSAAPAGQPLTPEIIDSTFRDIESENDQMLQRNTLWEQYEYVAGRMPPEAQQRTVALLSQFRKSTGDTAASLENRIRIFIDFPWGKESPSSIPRLPSQPSDEDINALNQKIAEGMRELRKELDQSHHGMDQVKDQILKYYLRDCQARAHTGEGVGMPILLVSHPGQGKTTFAKTIAKALNRRFQSLSLGGMKRIEELLGFNSGYVNSDTGPLMRAMINAGVIDPVMLADEIDKMERDLDFALLSITDPVQNERVTDQFTQGDFPFNRVLFIATANDISKIPGPVLDRFEVIYLPPYTYEEKVIILTDHALPEILEEWTTGDRVQVPDARSIAVTILSLISNEHGVRQAKDLLSKLIQNALIKSLSTTENVTITEGEARKLLGREKHSTQLLPTPVHEVGKINGLAYVESEAKGIMLRIVANLHKTDGDNPLRYKAFGQLGESMSSSLRRAFKLAEARAVDLNVPSLRGKELSVLLSPQDVSKDGDSAGVAFYFAILSALTGIQVRHDIAITGALSPSKQAMKVGAINGKITAAILAGARTIFLPAEVRDTVDSMVRAAGSTVSLVEDIDEELPLTIHIPRQLWESGKTEGKAQASIRALATAAGIPNNQLTIENGCFVVNGTAAQIEAFFERHKKFERPPTLVLFSNVNQIEDRVLFKETDNEGLPGAGGSDKGFLIAPFAVTLFALTSLALGFPLGADIGPIFQWATTNLWMIVLAVPALVMALATPLMIARVLARTPRSRPTEGAHRVGETIQITDEMAWGLLVDLNDVARTILNTETLNTFKDVIAQLQSNRPINPKDPLWIKLYPHIKYSQRRTPGLELLTTLMAQVNPDLNKFQPVPALAPSPPLPTSSLLETLRIRLLQT